MTVAELIKELREFPPDMQVYIPEEDERGHDLVTAPRPGTMYVRPINYEGERGGECNAVEVCDKRRRNAYIAVVL